MSLNLTIENLNKNGFIAKVFSKKEDLINEIAKNLSKDDNVGVGGSMTLTELNVPETLSKQGYKIISSATRDMDVQAAAKANRTADAYLTSSNAVTTSGFLVNIDGRGNRIAAMCYCEKVFYVVGSNKIVKDEETALIRIQEIAAPLNAIRLNRKTPCVATKVCVNCNSPERICKSTLITKRAMSGQQAFVFFMDEKLGY